ncbi:MAG: glycosyltransferase family 4 protein [Thermoguttaceae bacterium]|nr:glycosyltransferase family 4 protein [Thermoguttaceae bacterium]
MTFLYSSYHNYLDFSSGAALSMREVLLELARSGARVRALCGTFFDTNEVGEREHLATLKALGIEGVVQEKRVIINGSPTPVRLVVFNDSGIEGVAFFVDDSGRGVGAYVAGGRRLSRAMDLVYLLLFLDEVKESRPKYYATYGGFPLAQVLASEAAKRGAEPVFFLHNAQYQNRKLFESFRTIVTPSEFLRRHYQKTLDRYSVVLPPIIDESNVVASNNSRRFVTFVNPTLSKGLYPFITIARAINRIKPDVEFLLVEGREGASRLAAIPEMRELRNVYHMSSVREPRAFYSQTRILIMPSLCEEAFGRVAVEAALNRIPTLCSTRGALPEVVAEPRALLDLPDRLTPYAQAAPTEEEVAPWIERILELWQDENQARELGDRLATNAERFRQEVCARRTREFFL